MSKYDYGLEIRLFYNKIVFQCLITVDLPQFNEFNNIKIVK